MIEDDTKAPKAQAAPYPRHLEVETTPYKPGVKRVPVDRYFKQEYHDLEVERIWKKSWQWACREEEIPEVGDYHVYEVAELSFIVVRTGEHEFKAYWNSCLHRGRKLCTFDGKRASELRCMFHGWAWDIHGKMKDMTCGWDFPGTRDEVTALPECRTGTWGGFVFINPDPDCELFEEFIGSLPEYFDEGGHDLSKRWKQVHVVVDLAANWKVSQEAFLEAWHVIFTHPQLLRPPSDEPANGLRWDVFGNWIRSAPALPGDQHKTPPGYQTAAETGQQYVDQHFDYHLNEDPPLKVGPGEHSHDVVKTFIRESLRSVLGEAIDEYHDAHLNMGQMVSVWPNFHPWGAFSRQVYRFRPYKNDPNRSLMDVLLLGPWPEDRPRPPPAQVHVLGPGQSLTDAPELGTLARLFSQDMANIPFVQEGLKASRKGYVIFSQHHEAPLRLWHDQYERYMGLANDESVAVAAE